MKPEDLMRTPVTELVTDAEAFSPTDSVAKIIGHLKESKLTEALVEDAASTYIVSLRDLLKVTTLAAKAASIMHQVPRLGPNNNVSDSATLMREFRTRSLAVYKDRKMLGQITSPAIVARLLETDVPGKVSSLMTPSPVSLEASDKVSTARETMVRKDIDQLPVTQKRALFGVVTSDMLVFNLMPTPDRTEKGEIKGPRLGEALSGYANKDVLTNDVSDSLSAVYRNMAKAGSNYSLIMNTGEIQGIVTYRDFLTVLSKKASPSSVPMYIVGLPEDPFEAETARTKFQRAVELLRRSTPDLEEGRATIKMGETKAPRKKYQVKVLLVYPRQHYSYSIFSYELADAFDQVNRWMKEVAETSRPKKKKDHHARSYPDDWRPNTAPG